MFNNNEEFSFYWKCVFYKLIDNPDLWTLF